MKSITIYIFMHGEELIRKRLPQDMRHTFVSEIGKLGLIDLVDDNSNNTKFCGKIEEIKTIFKNEPTINEGNAAFKKKCDQNLKNKFDDATKIQVLEENDIYGIPDYKESECLVRVLDHDKIYSLIGASTEIEQKIHTDGEYNINLLNTEINSFDKQLIYDELYNCGIYIIETYGLDDEKKRQIEELNISIVPNPNCLNKNLIFIQNIQELISIMNESNAAIVNGYIDKLYEDENISSFYGVPRQPDFPIPDFQKIKEIHLSTILKIFYALGFDHVNIIEKSCRWIDDAKFYYKSKDQNEQPYDKPYEYVNPYKLLRQISTEEKERGKAVSERIYGGKRKRRKTIRKKRKQTKKQKTKKYKYKKYKM